VTASAGSGGSISPSGAVSVAVRRHAGVRDHGEQLPFDRQRDRRRRVAGRRRGYTFTNVQGTHTIAATFSVNGPYTVTASAGSGGSISPSGAVSVACGATQAFAVTAKRLQLDRQRHRRRRVAGRRRRLYLHQRPGHAHDRGHVQRERSLHGERVGRQRWLDLAERRRVVACGATQAFAVTANACNSIANVTVDGVSQGAIAGYTFTNVQGTHTIAATFSVNGPYTVTASAGSGGSISPSGAVSVACGATQAFSITANSCRSIANVTVDGVSQGAVAGYTFTNVQGTHTIAATFSVNGPYTVTASAGSAARSRRAAPCPSPAARRRRSP
jgi:predicted phage tail protein